MGPTCLLVKPRSLGRASTISASIALTDFSDWDAFSSQVRFTAVLRQRHPLGAAERSKWIPFLGVLCSLELSRLRLALYALALAGKPSSARQPLSADSLSSSPFCEKDHLPGQNSPYAAGSAHASAFEFHTRCCCCGIVFASLTTKNLGLLACHLISLRKQGDNMPTLFCNGCPEHHLQAIALGGGFSNDPNQRIDF
jgi:hypothetical protein